MAKVFSAGSNVTDVPSLVLDQAPGAPVVVLNPDGSLTITSPMTDFDGSPITPNGSGSSGCDNVYACGAMVAADGTSAIDSLSGAEATAGFQFFTEVSSPGQTHTVPAGFAPSLPGGGLFRVICFVSDGQDVV